MAAFTLGPALLFCPADRPERFAKAAARADAVILDLEDAVLLEHKAHARENLTQTLNWEDELTPESTIVRINGAASGEQAEDAAAVAGTEVRWVIVPKAEDPAELDDLAARLPGVGLIPQIETPRGVLEAARLAAHPSVVAFFWGTEDLIAGLGGAGARRADGTCLPVIRHARSQLLLTAGAYGIPAVDTIFTSLKDVARLRQETADAVAEGFIAKACIHPQQVPTIRSAYAPEPAQAEWAKALLVEFAVHAGIPADDAPMADPARSGAFRFRSEMVDAPVIAQAQRVIQRHEAALSTPG
ncbi:HpcH/HpaI aldolase/citrate lyase family protein [Nesterenkonia populi]